MAFSIKKFLLPLGSALILSCSAAPSDRFQIGESIEQVDANTMQVVEADGKATYYAYDPYSRRINFVDSASDTLQFSRDLGPTSAGRFWLASQTSSYYFDIKGNSISLTLPEGESSQEILRMAGIIKSYAADFSQGYFAFVDEFFSIGIIKMSAAGTLENKWIGSSIINGELNGVAGDMVPGGHLVLVTDKGTLVNIDLAATLANETWSHVDHALNFNQANWVGRVDGAADRVLILEYQKLNLVDLSAGAVLASVTFPAGTIPSDSKRGQDHIFYYSSASDKFNVIFPDTPNTLRELPIKLIGSRPVLTYLAGQSLTALTESQKIIQVEVRPADAVVTTSTEIDAKGKIGLSANVGLVMYDSPLGYMKLFHLDTGSSTTFEAFNRENLQSQ